MTAVFKGPQHRVQLTVFDFTECGIPAFENEPIKFCVRYLPNSVNMYMAYSLGQQPYCGQSFATAWGIVQKFVPDAVMPAKLLKYWPAGKVS